jgi:hypothetical protein
MQIWLAQDPFLFFSLSSTTNTSLNQNGNVAERWIDGWMAGCLDGWMDGWMDGRLNGWTDGINHEYTRFRVALELRLSRKLLVC